MEVAYTNNRERIEGKSLPVENVINAIVQERVGNLDMVIHKIKSLLDDETDQLTDLEIDDILLQLPLLLYDVTDDQELVGMQSDISSMLYKETYNEAYKVARGTINDKQSCAELVAMGSKLDSLIYDRAYKIIKQKINMAIETLNAVKKVQATRQQRMEISKFGPRF